MALFATLCGRCVMELSLCTPLHGLLSSRSSVVILAHRAHHVLLMGSPFHWQVAYFSKSMLWVAKQRRLVSVRAAEALSKAMPRRQSTFTKLLASGIFSFSRASADDADQGPSPRRESAPAGPGHGRSWQGEPGGTASPPPAGDEGLGLSSGLEPSGLESSGLELAVDLRVPAASAGARAQGPAARAAAAGALQRVVLSPPGSPPPGGGEVGCGGGRGGGLCYGVEAAVSDLPPSVDFGREVPAPVRSVRSSSGQL